MPASRIPSPSLDPFTRSAVVWAMVQVLVGTARHADLELVPIYRDLLVLEAYALSKR